MRMREAQSMRMYFLLDIVMMRVLADELINLALITKNFEVIKEYGRNLKVTLLFSTSIILDPKTPSQIEKEKRIKVIPLSLLPA